MKEAKKRRLEATSTATSTGSFTARARKSSDSLFLNFIHKTLMRARVLETDVRHARMGIRNRRTHTLHPACLFLLFCYFPLQIERK